MIIEFLCDQNPVQYIFVTVITSLSYSSVPLERLFHYSNVPLERLVILMISLVFLPESTDTVMFYFFPSSVPPRFGRNSCPYLLVFHP